MSINHPIQGSCADIIKMAMARLEDEGILDENCWMILQIHDELLFELRKNKIKEIFPKIEKIMENIAELKAPLKVDIKIGTNWGEMEAPA